MRGDFLAFGRVKIFEVSLGERFVAIAPGDFIHDSNWRLGENAGGGYDDFKLSLAELRKGGGRAASAGVEHGNILIKLGDVIAGFGVVTVAGFQRGAVRGKISP